MIRLRRKGQPLSDSSVRLRVSSGKPASEQVMFTEEVTAAEFKWPLFLELKTQSFSHLRVNKLRVFTKPAFWNTPQGWVAHYSLHCFRHRDEWPAGVALDIDRGDAFRTKYTKRIPRLSSSRSCEAAPSFAPGRLMISTYLAICYSTLQWRLLWALGLMHACVRRCVAFASFTT